MKVTVNIVIKILLGLIYFIILTTTFHPTEIKEYAAIIIAGLILLCDVGIKLKD